MGKDVEDMQEGEARSLINANARSGLSLVVIRENDEREIMIKEGAVYLVNGWHSPSGG